MNIKLILKSFYGIFRGQNYKKKVLFEIANYEDNKMVNNQLNAQEVKNG